MRISRSRLEEAELLLRIQKEAYEEDLLQYEDHDTSPVNEPIERLQQKITRFLHYTIWNNSEIIGGIDIRNLGDRKYRLNRIFLAKEHQNKGLGTLIMNQIESEFPQAKEWSLDTPYLNSRNRYFYEKLGYQQVGEHQVTEKLILIDYKKIIQE